MAICPRRFRQLGDVRGDLPDLIAAEQFDGRLVRSSTRNGAASGASRFESSYSLLELISDSPVQGLSSALKHLGRCPARVRSAKQPQTVHGNAPIQTDETESLEISFIST